MSHSPAASCSLEGRAFQERVREIAELNRRFLLRKHRSGSTLVLVYGADAREPIRDLVTRERQCCPALDFVTHEAGGEIELHIAAPSLAAERADALLRPFESEPSSDAAGCCGECSEPASPAIRSGVAAGSAIGASAVAIVACGACCVLPLAFPFMATGAMGIAVASLAAGHAWLIGLAALTLVGAWGWIWRQSRKRKARLATSTLVQMGAASVLMALVVAWPWIEPWLTAALAR